MLAPQNVLVPTDFTEDSDRALREAIDISKAFRASVFLLHVDEKVPEVAGDYAVSPQAIEAVEKKDEVVAKQKMLDEVKRIASETNADIKIAERHGVIHEEILNYAKEKSIDLIVIEPHVKKGVFKGLKSGIANRLIKKATCPILVLPAIQ